jgi:hypothetical protein
LPLASYPFGADYPGRTYYRTGLVPKQVTQMVDLSRARSVQRDWDAEREDLQDDLKSLRKDLENARTDLAVTEAQAAERIRRFRIADPAGRGAPLTEPAQ